MHRLRSELAIAVSSIALALTSASCGDNGPKPPARVEKAGLPASTLKAAGSLADEMTRLWNANFQVSLVDYSQGNQVPKPSPDSAIDVDAEPMTVRIIQFGSPRKARAFVGHFGPGAGRNAPQKSKDTQGTTMAVDSKVYVGTVADVQGFR
jgi:hypothetical protein